MKEKMQREKKVLKNTFLFALGSFFIKVVSMIVMPVFTFFMSPSEFGVVDIVMSTSTIIISALSLSIVEGVFRFTIGKMYDRKSIFTIGVSIVLMGGLLLFSVYSILYYCNVPYVRDIGLVVCLYLFFETLHPVIQMFIKGLERIGLYVFDGVLYATGYLVFGLSLVAGAKLGVNGYLGSIVLADIVCIIFLTLKCRLYRYYSLKSIDKDLLKKMLAYSVPMIFNNIAWWIMNLSDKYVISGSLGIEANGIIAISHKIPSVITMIYGIFSQAFVLSAIADYDLKKDKVFFNKIFNTIIFVVSVATTFLIVLIEPITNLIIDPDFYDSWRYVPLMLLAAVFNDLMAYCGMVYNIKMQNFKFAISTIIGGITNFLVCFLLINHIGLHAAALSTLVANIVMFTIRWVDIRKDLKLTFDISSIFTLIVIVMQILVCNYVKQVPYMLAINSILAVVLLLINIKKFKSFFVMCKNYIEKRKQAKLAIENIKMGVGTQVEKLDGTKIEDITVKKILDLNIVKKEKNKKDKNGEKPEDVVSESGESSNESVEKINQDVESLNESVEETTQDVEKINDNSAEISKTEELDANANDNNSDKQN